MRGGQSTGRPCEYQVFCRDLLLKQEHNLRPVDGEGIDVPIDAGGTTYTFDVALTDGHRLVLAECKRWQNRVPQREIALFAHQVELVREEHSTDAAGFFFAASAYQLGAIKVGEWEGIEVAVCAANQKREVFRLSYHSYDRERAKRLQWNVYHYAGGGSLRLHGSLKGKFSRSGGQNSTNRRRRRTPIRPPWVN